MLFFPSGGAIEGQRTLVALNRKGIPTPITRRTRQFDNPALSPDGTRIAVEVIDDDDGSIYYAPDADVLLSDAFLDTHCMSLVEGEDEAEGLVGLSFEPTQDRGVTDISGVLWLDPADAELQWLDYQYEFLDVPNSERLGGKIRFSGLPDGTWIVRQWYIRMPILESGRRRNHSTEIRAPTAASPS